MYYSISAEVPEGQGDYGSTWLTVLNAQKLPTKRIAVNVANRLASLKNTSRFGFCGQGFGPTNLRHKGD